jgi:O-antigen ligase
MKTIDLLWIMVWLGIYSNIENLQSPGLFNSPFGFLQGIRCVLPFLALFLCLLKALVSKHRRIPFLGSPLELLFYYALVAMITASLSPEPLISLYWGGLYLSPIMVVWYAMNSRKPLENIRRIMIINYVIFTILIFSFMPGVLKGSGIGGWNNLPFSLGEVNRNGVARYALIVTIFSFVRFINQRKGSRHLYLLLLLFALYLLMQTQSRSALLGLAVVTVLIFYIKGLNWRFIFLGPAFAYIIWMAGYKIRAESEFEKLVSLTGRGETWQRGLEQIFASPFFGWGFQADRLLLEFEHMHNSYLHVAIQSGLLGVLFFVGAIIGIWKLILRNKFFKEKMNLEGVNKFLVIESIAIVAFLTVRSFFESTAAFYGIDELILVAHICYLQFVAKLDLTPKH